MFRTVNENVWAIDAEWVPDPETGRRVYGFDPAMPDEEVVECMWAEAGATEENPRPYLKTVLCRLVSVAALVRRRGEDGRPQFSIHALPEWGSPAMQEPDILAQLLDDIGRTKPQLVGFNLINADLPIFVQRAFAHGITAPAYCRRPNKPWEGQDYFTRFTTEAVVDLMQIFSGGRGNTPRMHELATIGGIPGKMGTSGADVLDLWRAGEMDAIVEYNEFDIFTTYLIWLRAAHLAGHVSPADYQAEKDDFEGFLSGRVEAGRGYVQEWLDAWRQMRQ